MNTTWPNTPCYLIAHTPGSGGSTVNTLLHYYVNGDLGLSFKPSAFNNSHIGHNEQLNNWGEGQGVPLTTYAQGINWISALIDPRDSTRPCIFIINNVPLYREYFDRWPLGKVIIVTVDQESWPLLDFNLWYKDLVQTWQYDDQGTKVQTIWSDLQTRIPQIFSAYSSPLEVTSEDLGRYIREYPRDLMRRWPINRSELFVNPQIAGQYGDRVWTIASRDIWQNSDSVLAQLSEITGMATPEGARQYLTTYQTQQQALIARYGGGIDLAH